MPSQRVDERIWLIIWHMPSKRVGGKDMAHNVAQAQTVGGREMAHNVAHTQTVKEWEEGKWLIMWHMPKQWEEGIWLILWHMPKQSKNIEINSLAMFSISLLLM